jgi:hypothetical protein
MDKPLTLFDIWTYQQEINSPNGGEVNSNGPGRAAVNNILSYSRALDVINCKSTGNAFMLMN